MRLNIITKVYTSMSTHHIFYSSGTDQESLLEKLQGIGKIFNPSIPESDKCPISPYIITAESHIKVMRVKEMIAI